MKKVKIQNSKVKSTIQNLKLKSFKFLFIDLYHCDELEAKQSIITVTTANVVF